MMAEDLAVRIEAALTDWQRLAEAAAATHGDSWSAREGTDSTTARLFAAFDPSSVLRLITGIRDLAKHHQKSAVTMCEIDGVPTASCTGCNYFWPCPDFKTLARMLGVGDED